MVYRIIVAVACSLFFPAAVSAQSLPWPLIIGHRGASGLLPEHTLEAYELAIAQGAHFIEPDLVSTKDGVLIARHENELSDTTDVALKFPERKTTRVIDVLEFTGWFSEDFTLAEIKTLRATQRLPFRDQSLNGKYLIPTLDEVLTLIKRESAVRGRPIGIYPETKHPSYHQSIGLALEQPLLGSLRTAGLTRTDDWVFIQSFEVKNLKSLNEATDLRLIQLLGFGTEQPFDQAISGASLSYQDMITDRGLQNIATYADGIGPWKVLIVPQDREGNPFPATDLIPRAHAAGLVVHAYTFRDEPRYLMKRYNGDPLAEYRHFFALGVDGVFTDFPGSAVGAIPASP